MKTELIFDLETTGLLRKGSQIHCIVSRDLSDPDTAMVYDHLPERDLLKGVHQVMNADLLIGHNIISFDIPFLKERYPDLKPKGKMLDTLVLSKIYYPHIRDRDFERQPEDMPVKIYGKHSLEAWGYRLRCFKGDYGKRENAWEKYTPEMLEYCKQDTLVNYMLYIHLTNRMNNHG